MFDKVPHSSCWSNALLRNPDVLLFDEATNPLDRPRKRPLRAAPGMAHGGRAGIAAARRRDTIESTEHEIEFQQGCMVAIWTLKSLVQLGSLYAPACHTGMAKGA